MEQELNSVYFPLQNPNTLKTHTTAIDDDRHKRIMSNLKASVFARIKPSITITPQLRTHIEQRLLQFFPSFHTPSHPPYSSMIQKALELSDGEGLTEEAISVFIRKEYKDLPWGHESFLKHHLIKLCGNKEIACVKGRYALLVKHRDHKEIKGSSRRKQGGRVTQQRNQGRVKKMQKQIQREEKQIGVFEEPRDLEMLPVEVTRLKFEAPGQQNYTLADNNYRHIITKLKDLIYKLATNPSKAIAPEVNSNIEQRLQEFFPHFLTPTHPPYATMIQQAILELNQQGWLNEEQVSAFIKREHKLIHESFLHHYLEKLCSSWKVHSNDRQCMLVDKNSEFSDLMGEGMKEQLHGGRQCRDQGRVLPEAQHEVIREESLSLKPQARKQTKPEGQLIEVFEGPSNLEKQRAAVSEQRIDAIEVSEEDEECGRDTIEEERQLQGQNVELIPSEIKAQTNVLDEQSEAELTEIEMTEQVEETPHALELKQHKDQMTTSERDVRKVTFNKQLEGQTDVIATLKDICMESVKKTKRFEEQLFGFSLSLRQMKVSNSVTGKRKESLKEQQVQTQTSCSECMENLEMKSNIEVTEGQKQSQKQEEEAIWEPSHTQRQHIDIITKMSVSCRDGGIVCRESEEKQLQTRSLCERRELVSGLMARQHPQLKKLAGQQVAAKLSPDESSSFLKLQTDQGQHLDLSSMEQSPKPETKVNKIIIISSPSDPQHQYEQQPPKRRCRGRPLRLKPYANMITKSSLPSNDHDCNEQQQPPEGEGNGKCPAPTLVADATIALPSCAQDQNHIEKQQLQSRRKGRPRKRKRNCIYK